VYKVHTPKERFRDAKPLLPMNGSYSEYVTYIMYGCHREWNDLLTKIEANFYPDGIKRIGK
jgi:hypothetical protein